jgi:hypothetical protein
MYHARARRARANPAPRHGDAGSLVAGRRSRRRRGLPAAHDPSHPGQRMRPGGPRGGRAPTSDRLDDTAVGDDEAPVATPSLRVGGGRIELRGHGGDEASVTCLELTPSGDGVEIRATVTGRRPAQGRRQLGADEARRWVADLETSLAGEPGGAVGGDDAGSAAIHVAYARRIVAARVDRLTAARLVRIADLVLQEVALCGVGIRPDLHPLSSAALSAPRTAGRAASAPDVDDEDDTLVR